jgi:Domain of unknown function (DUF3387)
MDRRGARGGARLTAEIEKLDPQRERVRQLFVQRGVQPDATAEALEACVLLLEDQRLRAEFDVALELFLDTFDTVLPRPEALPFADDAVLFGEIQVLARRRYRDTVDGDFDPHRYKEKVRRLIDDHVTVLDLTQKVRPIRITDPDFAANVNALASPRTKASEMEHALRHHIREHLDEDPVYYGRLSERIDEILHRLEGRWEQIALELEDLVRAVNAGRTDEEGTGLDPEAELPFHNRLAERLASSDPGGSWAPVVRRSPRPADHGNMLADLGSYAEGMGLSIRPGWPGQREQPRELPPWPGSELPTTRRNPVATLSA